MAAPIQMSTHAIQQTAINVALSCTSALIVARNCVRETPCRLGTSPTAPAFGLHPHLEEFHMHARVATFHNDPDNIDGAIAKIRGNIDVGMPTMPELADAKFLMLANRDPAR